MPGYTEKFDIDLNDMDLIEEALRGQVKSLSAKRSEQACLDSERKLRNVKDLLGRPHNQKVFYRPKQGYIGG